MIQYYLETPLELMPKILVYGFEGCEPVETLGTIDVLRRAEYDVVLLS